MGGGDILAAFRAQSRRAALWFGVGVLSIGIANALLGLVSLLAVATVAIIGIALAGDAGGWAWRARARGMAATSLVAPMLAAAVLMWLAIGPVFYWSHVVPSWVRLQRERPAYEAALQGGPLPGGIASVAREGSRSAFLLHNGMLGAWRAIVHDPSGRLRAAKGWGGRRVPRDIRRLFGSETQWCQRLDGAWFHCHFD
ncbi:hypothetical protein [Sphingomonas baiyangensis]|uniref:Uncharacterized protein n=1 Tax=Sphingomonas baiyangensis TaxID=2572576 RepID=A0A4U1L656_9SPHN|nr:hypothetical protein [Sphingomonas baiyangensis]TKD51725.1 hypothetical protein FBR43_13885 [Sphingomonas baiyangensis]